MSDVLDGCPEYEDRLLESAFSRAPDADLEIHVRSCPRCRGARDGYRRAATAIAAALEAEPSVVPGAAGRRPRRSVPRRVALAAVAAAAILAAGWAVRWSLSAAPRVIRWESGSRLFRTQGAPVRVLTPAGDLHCAAGEFLVAVTPGGRAPVVTVEALVGSVRWSLPEGEVTLQAGETRIWRAGPPEDSRHAGSQTPEEPRPPEQAAAALRPLEIEIVSEEGRPQARARVLVLRDGRLLDRGETDDRGRVRLPARAGSAQALVAARGLVPHLESIALEPGLRRIRIRARGVVAGGILVNGRVPEKPVSLTLSSDDPWPALWGLTSALLKDLESIGTTAGGLSSSTDDEGRFRFRGLPEAWSGTLEVPAEFALEASLLERRSPYIDPPKPRRRLYLRGPKADLEIRLSLFPLLTGRVVSAGSRKPLGEMLVTAWLDAFNGPTVESCFRTDADGRFRVPLDLDDLMEVKLWVADAGWRQGTPILQVPPRLFRGGDLGTIEFEPPREVSFVVRDEEGRPVAGAIAAATLEVASEPTDAGGRTRFRVPRAGTTVHVAAFGWQGIEVPIPEGVQGPIPVVLPRGNLLQIRPLRPTGEIIPWLDIVLSAEGPLFLSGDGSRPDLAHRALGAPHNLAYGRKDGRWFISFGFPEDGAWVPGLRPGLPITVQVKWGGAVLSEALVSLGPEESRTLDLVVDRPCRGLRGVVTDLEGNPLDEAEVSLEAPDEGSAGTTTLPNGRFDFGAVLAETARLRISRDGYLDLVVPDLLIPADGRRVPFRMDPGASVTIRVRDVAGRPIPDAWVEARQGDPAGGRTGFPLGDGSYRVTGLRQGDVVLTAWLSGRTYEIEHDTALPEATIVVPIHGSLRVRWTFEVPWNRAPLVRLRPLGTERPELERLIKPDPGRAGGEAVLASVLPGTYVAQIEASGEGTGERRVLTRAQEVTVAPLGIAEVTFEP